MRRKLKYYLEIIPISREIRNWPLVIALYFGFVEFAVLKLVNGMKFKVSHYLDALTLKETIFDHQYPFSLRNPRTIVDIGANVGDFSIMAALAFPKARVIALEPAAKTFALLKYNIALNNSTNVTALNIGASNTNGYLKLYSQPASGLSSMHFQGKASQVEKIKTRTLTAIFKENKIRRCDYLKIDCEGAEYDTLLTCPRSTANKIEKIAIEYHNGMNDYNYSHLVSFLREMNFSKLNIIPHPLETQIGIIYAEK